jgi:hypothetical protein
MSFNFNLNPLISMADEMLMTMIHSKQIHVELVLYRRILGAMRNMHENIEGVLCILIAGNSEQVQQTVHCPTDHQSAFIGNLFRPMAKLF